MDKLQTSFINGLKCKNYSKLTLNAYSTDIKQFRSFFNDPTTPPGSKDELRSWKKFLAKKYKNNSTIRRKINTIKAFYEWLHNFNYIQLNPANVIELPKEEKSIPTILTFQTITKVLNRLKGSSPTLEVIRNLAILELLYGTGIRLDELINLSTQNIDFHNHTIKVKGKGKKERVIPFMDSVAQALRDYLPFTKENGTFFLTNTGKPLYPNFINQVVKMYFKNATPHTLRHCYATHLLDNGAHIRAIQELLGHSSVTTTQRYTQVSLERVKKIHNRALR